MGLDTHLGADIEANMVYIMWEGEGDIVLVHDSYSEIFIKWET